MSSKYPNQYDVFELKRDAQYDGDPNGSYVMAADINNLQDSVQAIQSALGINPEGDENSVANRLNSLGGTSLLNVPSFLIYLGDPALINGVSTSEEAIPHFAKFKHVVLGKAYDNVRAYIIGETKKIAYTKFYGYIDCGVNTLNLSISEISNIAQQWIDAGADGIYCANMGYDVATSRTRQNEILNLVHGKGAIAILDGTNYADVLSDAYHEVYNPDWTPPNLKQGDKYHYDGFAYNSTSTTPKIDVGTVVNDMNNLYPYRLDKGIDLIGTAIIPSTSATAKEDYRYAHSVGLLTSLDSFGASEQDNSETTNKGVAYESNPIIGDWYSINPKINVTTDINNVSTYEREAKFGKIRIDGNTNTHLIGIKIPTSMLRAEAGTLDGSALKDVSVPSTKIADYDSSRVIDAINANTTKSVRIDFAGEVVGSVPSDALTTNVIQAINLYAGTATIQSGKIGNLEAEKITAGSIAAERISSTVVAALDLYAASMTATSATINTAAIGELTVDNLKAAVISAVNLSTEAATINEAAIGNLSAEKITAGDIAGDRIRANVISAVNAYAEDINITNKATIKAAAIGSLTAENIQAEVIKAVNASVETATINSAKIGSLTADKIQAEVIKAINASVETATIGAAKIGSLKAENIQAEVIKAINASIETATIGAAKVGTLTADHIKSTVVDAINLYSGTATINEAFIGNLSASKITAGDIAAARMTTNAISAINLDATTATIDAAQVGALTADHIKASVVEAVNLNATTAVIDAAKVGALTANHISASVVDAINLYAGTATIGAAKIGSLDASKITTGSLDAGRLTANVVTAINTYTGTAVIDQGKIGNLSAEKITAGDITADRMKANAVNAINASIDTLNATHALIDSAAVGTLSADHIQASVISAINVSTETATINNGKIGTLTSDHIKGSVVEAINLNATTAVIDQGKIGNLDATKITTGELAADRIKTTAISAINAYADDINITNKATIKAAAIGSLVATNIQAEVVKAINASVETATINSAKIGSLTADKIQAEVVKAINASIETATIDSAKISALTADHIKSNVVEAINLKATTALIDSAKVGVLTADHIKSTVVEAINLGATTATIGAAKIGTLTSANIGADTITSAKIAAGAVTASEIAAGTILADNISAGAITSTKIATGAITSDHIYANVIEGDRIKVGTLNGDRILAGTIDATSLKAETVTATEIAALAITSDKLATGAVRADKIRAGVITAEHISTTGLDAEVISVYNSSTGQTLIGAGYLRVDGLDVGVVQSDNLVGNGLFLTSSSSYGHKRYNPAGEATLGSQDKIDGGHQLWKIDLGTDAVASKIDIKGKKPVEFAIDSNGTYGYVTVQGDDTLVQVDLAYDVLTGNKLNMGKGPGRMKYTGADLGDHKHFFILNTDPTDVNIPDSLMVVDAPPTSDDRNGDGKPDLYVHHQLPLGNMPYDFVVSTSDRMCYITQAEQGDIAVFSMNGSPSSTWGIVGSIPIAPYGTDNYHGGLPGQFGLGVAMGGDDSSSYNLDGGHDGHHHQHGGYGTSDGTLRRYEPHGIEISSSSNVLYVTDHANGDLVLVNRGEADKHSFGIHSGDHDHSGGGKTNAYVFYRLPIGDSPEFMKLVSGKLFVSIMGSNDIIVIDESELDRVYNDIVVNGMSADSITAPAIRRIATGSKPTNITVDSTRGHLYVTANGQNQVLRIDIATETVLATINTGPNPMGVTVSSDGAFLYVVNHGGAGSLSFVYPKGAYIGDAFLGLEGGVEHQGAEFWVPNRSDWMYDPNNKMIANSTVEFRVNEPFLNEGGYVRLSTYAKSGVTQKQFAQIEQDINNVVNYSNGNNTMNVVGEALSANAELTLFYPNNEWIQGSVSNVLVCSYDSNGNKVTRIPDPANYTVYDSGNSYIEFVAGVIVSGEWVEADYTHKHDIYFKTHNGSVLVAIENSSSPNFTAKFEIEEFVPKFVAMDNQQTGLFTPTEDGINQQYSGVEYSTMTNRALNIPTESIHLSSDGSAELGMVSSTNNLSVVVDGSTTDDKYITAGDGLQYATLDLGSVYMVGKVHIWRPYTDSRTYHETKVEISEDGTNWLTVFDSATSGEYQETSSGKLIEFRAGLPATDDYIIAKPTRYVRSWSNGWSIYDSLGAKTSSGTSNDWVEIQAFGDWELETSYVYPQGADKAGQQIATNGKGVVTTNIPKAWAAVDIPIEFTTWWYMTYLIGPEFGQIDIEMPTAMAGSHSLFQDGPYINKVAHRHVMPWSPSQNIKADSMMKIKAGKHRAVIRQKSGKVSIDRFRFEDFQYHGMSSMAIQPESGSVNFERQKIIPTRAKWYEGKGIQSSYGAYDTPRTNPSTGLRDYSVPIKYRFRVKAELNPVGTSEERGVAYATSAIFETGKLHSHWRMSQSADSFPGNRIEAWDPNKPHRTGIQNHHLANGSVRGSKIMPLAVMDHHVSPYARIRESKLLLNHATHGHGHYMTMNGVTEWHDNKHVLDSIHDWIGSGGDYGSTNKLARGDHKHSQYVEMDVNGIVQHTFTLGANITVIDGVTIDGVDVSGLKLSYDSHVGSGGTSHAAVTTTVNGFMIAGDKAKLDGIQSNAINQATADTLYLKATGGSIADQLKITSAGDATLTLEADTDNDTAENGTPKIIMKQDGGIIGGEFYMSQDGTVTDNAMVLAPFANYNTTTPSKNYSVFIHDKKIWHEGSLSKSEFTPASHVGTGGASHAAVTTTVNGFMIAGDKSKLDGIEANAINQTTADGRYLKLVGGTLGGTLIINKTSAHLQFQESGTNKWHIESVGGTLKFVESGVSSGRLNILAGGGVTIDGGTVWHSGNDGSGSGLDADLLDGKHAVDFLASTIPYAGLDMDGHTTYPRLIPVNNPSTSTDTNKDNWIRVGVSSTVNSVGGGLIPYLNGSSQIGTSSWEFKAMYATNFYEGGTALSSKYLGINAKAVDSDKLDGLDSASFVRSDVSDTISGNMNMTSTGSNLPSHYYHNLYSGNVVYSHAFPAGTSVGTSTSASKYVWRTLNGAGGYDSTELIGGSGLYINGKIVFHDGNKSSYLATYSGTTTITYTDGFMKGQDKEKLDGIAVNANNYSHPTGDGNLHVPATSTTNDKKVLKAGSTAGSIAWGSVDWTEITSKPTTFTPSAHTHPVADITDIGTYYYNKTEVDNKVAATGDVYTNKLNTLTDTNTFTKVGLAVKLQPSSVMAGGTVLFQMNNSAGNSLVKMGAGTDETTAKVVINGDLEVTGNTVQKSTQDVSGDMNISGNLNVAGDSILGDAATDQTTIKGDLVIEGNIKPKGRYLEVGRFPVYGIGGDLQFQTDSTVLEEITTQFNVLDTAGGGSFPTVSTGATRYYKIMVSYSDTGTGDSTIQLTNPVDSTSVMSFILPVVNRGVGTSARTWMSAAFSTTHAGDIRFDAKNNATSNQLGIRYIEVIAYDYYA